MPCIGIAGVWNWRNKLDNDERLTCPELDQIIWQGREVEIIPDSDGWREDKRFDVLAGFYALAMDLIQRRARVQFVKLPELIPGIKTGLDDWLVRKGSLWQWEWDSLERVPMEDPRLRKLAKWWQGWNLRQGEARTISLRVFHLTDLGNCERFVRDHGDSLRYVHKWKKWLEWVGQRWRAGVSQASEGV